MWRMRVACWISNALDAHAHINAHAPGHAHTRKHSPTHANTRKETSNTAFERQQMLHKRATMLRYTYIACFVFTIG